MSLAPSWAPIRRWWEREAAGSGSLVVVKEFRDSAARRSGLFTTRGHIVTAQLLRTARGEQHDEPKATQLSRAHISPLITRLMVGA